MTTSPTLKLALLDLDGTLKLPRDPYLYLHQQLGTMDAARELTERGKHGEIGYTEWTERDVALWRGATRAAMTTAFRRSPYLPGARELIAALHRAGVEVALISSGLDVHARLVADELAIQHVISNEVVFVKEVATGEVRFGVPEGHKGPLADRLLAERGLTPAECLAMGDSSSDIELFERAAVRVAVAPVPGDRIRAVADIVLDEPDLRDLLPRLRAFHADFLPPALRA